MTRAIRWRRFAGAVAHASARLHLFRWAILTAGLTACTAAVGYLYWLSLWSWIAPPAYAVRLPIVIAVVSAAALAAVLAWRAETDKAARSLSLFLVLLALYASSYSALLLSGVLYGPGTHDEYPRVVFWIAAHSTLWLAVAAGLRFSVLFPKPLETDGGSRGPGGIGGLLNRRPWLLWGSAVALGVLPFLGPDAWPNPTGGAPSFLPVVVLPWTRGDWWFLGPIGVHKNSLYLIATLALFPLAGWLATVNLRAGFAAASAAGRRQILWVVAGFVLLAAAVLAAASLALLRFPRAAPFAGGWTLEWIVDFGVLGLLACLAVAVFGAGAFDPTLVIRRTTLYGTLGLTLVFLFAGVQSVIEGILAQALGGGGRVSSFLAAGLLASLVLPLRSRLAGLIARLEARLQPVRLQS